MKTHYRIVRRETFAGARYFIETKRWWLPVWLKHDPIGFGHCSQKDAEQLMRALSGLTPMAKVVETDVDMKVDAVLHDKW